MSCLLVCFRWMGYGYGRELDWMEELDGKLREEDVYDNGASYSTKQLK